MLRSQIARSILDPQAELKARQLAQQEAERMLQWRLAQVGLAVLLCLLQPPPGSITGSGRGLDASKACCSRHRYEGAVSKVLRIVSTLQWWHS